jgi:hypothetical protein
MAPRLAICAADQAAVAGDPAHHHLSINGTLLFVSRADAALATPSSSYTPNLCLSLATSTSSMAMRRRLVVLASIAGSTSSP